LSVGQRPTRIEQVAFFSCTIRRRSTFESLEKDETGQESSSSENARPREQDAYRRRAYRFSRARVQLRGTSGAKAVSQRDKRVVVSSLFTLAVLIAATFHRNEDFFLLDVRMLSHFALHTLSTIRRTRHFRKTRSTRLTVTTSSASPPTTIRRSVSSSRRSRAKRESPAIFEMCF